MARKSPDAATWSCKDTERGLFLSLRRIRHERNSEHENRKRGPVSAISLRVPRPTAIDMPMITAISLASPTRISQSQVQDFEYHLRGIKPQERQTLPGLLDLGPCVSLSSGAWAPPGAHCDGGCHVRNREDLPAMRNRGQAEAHCSGAVRRGAVRLDRIHLASAAHTRTDLVAAGSFGLLHTPSRAASTRVPLMRCTWPCPAGQPSGQGADGSARTGTKGRAGKQALAKTGQLLDNPGRFGGRRVGQKTERRGPVSRYPGIPETPQVVRDGFSPRRVGRRPAASSGYSRELGRSG
jgi:hypothetical protein